METGVDRSAAKKSRGLRNHNPRPCPAQMHRPETCRKTRSDGHALSKPGNHPHPVSAPESLSEQKQWPSNRRRTARETGSIHRDGHTLEWVVEKLFN